MNICILTKTTLVHCMGGVEIHCQNLTKGLVSHGHPVTLIATRHPKGIEYEETNGVKIHYLRNTESGIYSSSWWRESARKFFELNTKEKFDLLISEGLSASGWVKFSEEKMHTPLISTLHGVSLDHIVSEFRQCASFIDYLKYPLIKIPEMFYYTLFYEINLLRKSNAIIVVNEQIAEKIQKRYGIERKKICVVYNGIDTELFKPDWEKRQRIRQRYGVREEEKLLLMLGVVSKQKGFHIGIHAFSQVVKKVPQAKLMIVGDGSYLNELKKLTNELNLEEKIIFTGKVKNEEVPFYYNACDLFIFPTLRMEGLPFVLLEAMSCGKPVIVSRIGGTPSAVDDSVNGFLVPPGNIEILAERILEVLRDETLAERFAKNAREKAVTMFSKEKMVTDYLNISQKLIVRNV